MHSLPIFLSLNQREALIVGGGEAATQKLRLLKRTGARITVVAKDPSAEIEAAAVTDEIMYELMKLSGQEYVDVYATSMKKPKTSTPRTAE